ncbi:monooxygenase [Sporothrix stenoceras]|uniref:Monooxygenase n=1 Tax=Sporothrix stenoceras TaxID=5173 RepID=A0ABR3Z3J1_9PEZI
MTSPPRFAVRSVAIIGAGSSGLTAARYIQAQGVYDRIVVYEQRSEVGGIWNYSPRPTDQEHIPQESPYFKPDAPLQPEAGKADAPEFPTATYDELYVNIPHPLMGFTDMKIADIHNANHPSKPLPIFPHRQTIAEYLIGYSQEVRHLIRFSTKVDNVRLLRRPRNWQRKRSDDTTSNTDDYVDSWEIHSSNTIDGTPTVETFDAVLVAQGHYDITFTPNIANIEAFKEAHPGVLTHSKRYRVPDPYHGKKVIVVGNSASGLDIATQIKTVTKELYMSVHSPVISDLFKRLTGAEEVPEIAEFLVEERGVRLTDGHVLHDIDNVIFCTGYLFSLPFLEKSKPLAEDAADKTNTLGSMLSNGRRIHRLYDDMFHIDHPTLAFLCLPMKVVPYPLTQAQAAIVSRVWANTLDLPTTEEMNEWEREAEKVRGPTFHMWQHGDDGVYINAWYEKIMHGRQSATSRAGKEPPHWDDKLVWMRAMTLFGKVKFEEGGQKATSLKELGYEYDPKWNDKPAEPAAVPVADVSVPKDAPAAAINITAQPVAVVSGA